MLDPEPIRAAVAANLADLAKSERLQVVPYMLAEPTPPTIDIPGLEAISYDIAGSRGDDSCNLLVRAVVALISDIGAQKKLDRLLASSGSSSLKQALERKDGIGDGVGPITLGGLISDLRVTECSGQQVYERPSTGQLLLGALWTVQIETGN